MTLQTIIIFALGVISAALFGFAVRPMLIRWKFGQPISEYIEEHKAKNGTPTAGGLIFIIPSFAMLIFINCYALIKWSGSVDLLPMNAVALLALCNGAIGFLDDYSKKHRHENEGLKPYQKLILQFAVAAAFVAVMAATGRMTTSFEIVPGVTGDFGFFYYIIAVILIVLFCNAVNLTDGLDGLAGSSAAFVLAFSVYMMISVWFVLPSLRVSALWASCLCGSVVGFLFWNVYPAKLFMGDTGSLFLGGAIGGLAISSGRPVMFLIVSFVFIADFASSILQISIFKITKHLSKKKEGWRLFKTAPVHHTFQRSGWSETKISLLFSTVTILLCLFGIVIYL